MTEFVEVCCSIKRPRSTLGYQILTDVIGTFFREAVAALRCRCVDNGRSDGFEADAVEVPQVRGETAFYFM